MTCGPIVLTVEMTSIWSYNDLENDRWTNSLVDPYIIIIIIFILKLQFY